MDLNNKAITERHWFFSQVFKIRSSLAKAIFLNVIMQFLQIVVALFSMVVYNKILPNYALPSLYTLLTGVAMVIIFDFMLKWLKARLVSDAGDQVDAELQNQLFKKVLSWDLETRPKLAGASSSLSRDLENLTELFTNASLTTAIGVPFILFNCVIIYLIAGKLAFITAFVAFLAFGTSLYFYFKVNNISDVAKKSSLDKLSVFVEALNNLETLKSIANYKYFEEQFKLADITQRDYGKKLKNITADANNFNAFLSSLAQVMVISFGAFLVIQGEISSGALIGTVILNGKTLQPCFQLANLLQRVSIAKVSYKRLSSTFNFFSEEEKRRENIRLSKLEGDIKIEKLNFQPPSLNKPIFQCQRLSIKEGEKIGIVGSVGSGKSTFLKLIAGILTPSTGTVSFGSFNTTAINQSDFRRDLAYLGQQPGIFSGSVRDNLVFGNEDVSDDHIVEMMRVTGMDHVIKSLPNGLSYILSENGSELSGGQKQILALTRALVMQPSYILFDEPTSAMDPKHEKLFVKTMADYVKDRTMLVVTHRKPILALTDRLIVIENGQIILDGNRDDVLKKFA